MTRHTTYIRRMTLAVGSLLCISLLAQTAWAQDCKPAVKEKLQKNLTATDAQVNKGKELYNINCIACHGEKGLGDGPAGKAIKARNFVGDKFVRGTSVLAIYKTLTVGLNANMPGFETIPDDERIAVAHYVRSLMPKEKWEEPSPEQLEEACIEISNPKLPAIPVAVAMDVLAEEAEAARKKGRADNGPVKINDAANKDNGAVVFGMEFASCHGDKGQGMTNYGRFGRWPYVQTSTYALQNNSAYGTWDEFALRVAEGPHATLPDFTGAATFTEQDWKDVQGYMSGFAGTAKVVSDAPPPADTRPALLSVGEGYEVFFKEGKLFKLVTNTEDAEAPIEEITSFDAFKALYKKIHDGATALPETYTPGAILEMEAVTNMTCIGDRVRAEGKNPGCGPLPSETRETTMVKFSFAPPAAEEGDNK